jgi:uncharacterized RDD family membrane protein YckC
MGNAWYIAVDGETVGPYPREEMERLRATGGIADDTPVWCEGMADWAAFADSDLNLAAPSPSEAAAEAVRLARSAHPWPDFQTLPALFGAEEEQPGTVRTPRLIVEDDGWQSLSATPWRRCFARMFDMLILGTTIWFLLGFVLAATSTRLYEALIGPHGLDRNALLATMMTLALVAPLEALMVGLSGTTPGKWVFGVRITRPTGQAIGLLRAGRREAAVLLRGLGLGIPLIALVTMIVGYRTLEDTGSASWDSGKPWVVTYRESGGLQTFLFIAGALGWLIALVIIEALAAKAKG